jgi:predicted alpha-1,6-mannanase (GH76 family)
MPTEITVDYEKMARHLVFNQILAHSLPWRVEQDWMYEVTASDGYIIAKCPTEDEAEQIIELANQIRAEIDAVEMEEDGED